MPEGDTLARISAVLRPVLVGREITAARGRPGGAQLGRLIGRTVESVEARGKHLLVGFSGGLTLHTHLGLHGSWHRYRRGEPWRRATSRAVAVLEASSWLAVCFDAPTVELLDTRALAIHPALRRLGTDIATETFDVDDALRALRARPAMAVGDALLDQRAVAGLGNVYRSELPFIERVHPLAPVSEVGDRELRAMLERGHRLVRANSAGGRRVTTTAGSPGALYVYGRAGRPCRRCATTVASAVTVAGGSGRPRRVYWCPACQRPSSQSRVSRGGHGRTYSQGTTAQARIR